MEPQLLSVSPTCTNMKRLISQIVITITASIQDQAHIQFVACCPIVLKVGINYQPPTLVSR